MSQVCISAVTEGELRFSLALKPEAVRLAQLVEQFLAGVTALPWDSAAAAAYGRLCAASWSRGKRLAALDLLIAAHALSLGLTLVTSDASFDSLRSPLVLANWAK